MIRGLKMKGIKLFILLILVLSLFQFNLYSLITSRVEGTVVDKDTGEIIKNARVVLYGLNQYAALKDAWGKIKRVKTNDKGYFRFDDLKKGKYLFCIYREGYAFFGPTLEYKTSDSLGSLMSESNGATFENVDGFYLKEGQIKHFKIKLEKEAILEIKVLIKTPNGTYPVEKEKSCFVVELIISDSNISYISEDQFSYDNGISRLKSLPGGKMIRLKIVPEEYGYPEKDFEVSLEKAKTTRVEYVLDFTIGQVVHGFIRGKETGKPLENFSIYIGRENREETRAVTDKNGEFWIGGLESGKNIVFIFSGLYNIRDKFYITIQPNEKIELNKEY